MPRPNDRPVQTRGRPPRTGGSLLDDLPLVEGAVAGAAAFVVGIVATLVLDTNVGEETPVFNVTVTSDGEQLQQYTAAFGELGSETTQAPSSFDMATWIYHKAHFGSVGGEVSNVDLGLFGRGSISVEFLPSPGISLLLPVVVLAGAGYLLAQRNPAATPKEAARIGASVVAGYGPVAVLSAFLVTWTVPDIGTEAATLTVRPSLVTAILLAGVAYPVIFGAAGGYFQHTRQQGSRRAHTPHGGLQPPRHGHGGGQQAGYQHGDRQGDPRQGSRQGGPQQGTRQDGQRQSEQRGPRRRQDDGRAEREDR